MKESGTSLLIFLWLLLYINLQVKGSDSLMINRTSFPHAFIFGIASSAYQIEGATSVDGRRPSIWDTFVNKHSNKIKDHTNGDVAEEFYFRYKKDIALLKEIGVDSFRFSISWPRILPLGKISRGVNPRGVKFYNFLIDELLSYGIQPFVTLFHWDLPQALEDEYGGFLSPKILDDYRNYVDFCFQQFGDRVKYWVTMNEPNLFSEFGYDNGRTAPGRCSSYVGNCTAGNSAIEPYIVTHHLLLAHATAVQLYRQNYQARQQGRIGITVNSFWTVPKYDTESSRKAASTAFDFMIGWIVHPLTYGDYPDTMRCFVGDRLPKFTKEQVQLVKRSVDFFGINYYTAKYASDVTSYSSVDLSYATDSRVNLTSEKDGIPIGEPTSSGWIYIYPKGIRDLVLFMKTKYKNTPIFITENGLGDANNRSLAIQDCLNDTLRIKYHGIPIGEPTSSGWIYIYPKGIRDLVLFMKTKYKNTPIFITENGLGDANNRSLAIQDCLNDTLRIKYHHLHLSYLLQAIEKGADVRGYYAWTFMDDFEWEYGFTVRYGFAYIDFTNGLQRILKKSAYWLNSFLQPRQHLNISSHQLFSSQ